jgi:hypothetical protein
MGTIRPPRFCVMRIEVDAKSIFREFLKNARLGSLGVYQVLRYEPTADPSTAPLADVTAKGSAQNDSFYF